MPRYFYEPPLRSKGSGMTATQKIEKRLAELKTRGLNPGNFEIAFGKASLHLPVNSTKQSSAKSVTSRTKRVNETMDLHSHPIHQATLQKIQMLREEVLLQQLFGEKAGGIDSVESSAKHNIFPSIQDIAGLIIHPKLRTRVVISLGKNDPTKVAGYVFIRKTPEAKRILAWAEEDLNKTKLEEGWKNYQQKTNQKERIEAELHRQRGQLKRLGIDLWERAEPKNPNQKQKEALDKYQNTFQQFLQIQNEVSSAVRVFKKEQEIYTKILLGELKKIISKTGYMSLESRANNAGERIQQVKAALAKVGIQIRVVPNTKNGYQIVEKHRKTLDGQHIITRIEYEKAQN